MSHIMKLLRFLIVLAIVTTIVVKTNLVNAASDEYGIVFSATTDKVEYHSGDIVEITAYLTNPNSIGVTFIVSFIPSPAMTDTGGHSYGYPLGPGESWNGKMKYKIRNNFTGLMANLVSAKFDVMPLGVTKVLTNMVLAPVVNADYKSSTATISPGQIIDATAVITSNINSPDMYIINSPGLVLTGSSAGFIQEPNGDYYFGPVGSSTISMNMKYDGPCDASQATSELKLMTDPVIRRIIFWRIECRPEITVEPEIITSTLTYKQADMQLITISNTGTAVLTYTVQPEWAAPWMDLYGPLTGEINVGESKSFMITLTSPNAFGTWTNSLTISSNDPDHPVTTIPVTMTVVGADITVNPMQIETTLAMGAVVTQTISICNNSTTTVLSWSVAESPYWINLNKYYGEVDLTPNNLPNCQNVEIKFDATQLTTGTYTYDLIVNNNDPVEPELSVQIILHVFANLYLPFLMK